MPKAGQASAPETPDTGCHVAPKCLECPRPTCIADDAEPFSRREDVLLAKLNNAEAAHRLLAYRSVEVLERRLGHLRFVAHHQAEEREKQAELVRARQEVDHAFYTPER